MERQPLRLVGMWLVAVAAASSPWHAWAGEKEIAASDYARVIRSTAPVTDGGKVVATVKKGDELYVERVSGNAVYVTLKSGGKRVRGWVHRRDVAPSLLPGGSRAGGLPRGGDGAARMTRLNAQALAAIDKVPVEFLAVYAEALQLLKLKRQEVVFLLPLEGDYPRHDILIGKKSDGAGATYLYREGHRFKDDDLVPVPAPPSRELAAKIRSRLASGRLNPSDLDAYRHIGILIGKRGDPGENASVASARQTARLWQQAHRKVLAAPTKTRRVW